MLIFNRFGLILQLFILLILIAGIGAGIYLVKSGHLKLFSKAGSDQTRIEFLDSSGNQMTTTSSPGVKLKLTYRASDTNSFSVGANVTGITHYGYTDTNPYCSASAAYAVGGAPLSSPVPGGAGANLYVNPAAAGVSTPVTVIVTADPKCSANTKSSFGSGLGNCRGGCGDGGVSDGCTCSSGNPKDTKSCWWRWTCTVTTTGSYTASFNTVLLNVPSSNMDADLVEMQRMGMKVIRIFAANKNIDDNEAARRLGLFLDKANSYGISAIVSLIDFYNSGFSPQGTEAFYTGNYNGIGLLGQEFFAGGYQGKFKDFVRTLVEANKGKGNIYAWEPGNELKFDANPQIFVSFMKDITDYIKGLDSSHRVATGMMYASHTALSPQDLYSQLPAVDLVTVHTYDGDRNGVSDLNWAKANNKGVIVEEFGFSGTGDRSDSVRNELNFWKGQGVLAILQWGLIAKGLPDNGNGDGKYGMDTIWHTDYDTLSSIFQSNKQTGSSFPTAFRVANSQSELVSAQEQEFNMNGKVIDWTLASGNGTKTVYAQFKVDGAWQDPISANVTLSSPASIYTTQFRLAESPTDLTNALWQPYTANGMTVDHDFQTPGVKTIFVQFMGSNNNASCGDSKSYCSAQITILDSIPTFTPIPTLTPLPTPVLTPSPTPVHTPTVTSIITPTPAASLASPTPVSVYSPIPTSPSTQTPSVRAQVLPSSPLPVLTATPVSTSTPNPHEANTATAFQLIQQRKSQNTQNIPRTVPSFSVREVVTEVSPSPQSTAVAGPISNIPLVGRFIDYVIGAITNALNFWKQI